MPMNTDRRPTAKFPHRLAALACLVLASCTSLPSVGPAYRIPAFTLPTAWRSATPPPAEPATLRNWWQQLDDGELDRLIARALAANSDLQQAEARLRQARATRSQAVGALFPSLAASTGANRQHAPESTSTLYDAGFDASWEIDLFGGRRPDLIAAERQLAAETARTGQKLAARFPSLTLNASFGWQAYSLGALGGSDTLLRTLAGSLAATLFDGGRLRAAVDAQQAVAEEALAAYRGSVLGAIEEVENALFAHAAARDRLAARRLAADAARNAALLSRQLYESGLADFRDVLDSERTRLSAEDNLALAEASQLSSLVKLYKALGGGWDNTATDTP